MPKKSLPKKGKPGLLARTTILKSGWITITFSLPSTLAASEKRNRWFVKLCSKWCQVFLIQLSPTGCGRTYEWHQWGSHSIRNTRKKKITRVWKLLCSTSKLSFKITEGQTGLGHSFCLGSPSSPCCTISVFCSLQSKDAGWVLTLESVREPGKGQYSG